MTFLHSYNELSAHLEESGIFDFWAIGAGMQYFTDHGRGHCARVQSKLVEFNNAYPHILKQDETDILSAAILVHDVGHVVAREGHAAASFAALSSYWGEQYYYVRSVQADVGIKDRFTVASVVANMHCSKPLDILIRSATSPGISPPFRNLFLKEYPILSSVQDQTWLASVKLLTLGGLIAFLDACDNDNTRTGSGLQRAPLSVALCIEEVTSYLLNEDKEYLVFLGFPDKDSNLASQLTSAWWASSEKYWTGCRHINQIRFVSGGPELAVEVDRLSCPRPWLFSRVIPALYSVLASLLCKDLKRAQDAYNAEAAPGRFPVERIRILDPSTGLDFTCVAGWTLLRFRQAFRGVW